MMKRTITVLQDDIDNGHVRDPEGCPIARAATRDLADMMPENSHIGVATDRVTLWTPFVSLWSLWTLRLPSEARDFIRNFDNLSQVEPFKFEVEFVEELSVTDGEA
jgi:hypothetical protein